MGWTTPRTWTDGEVPTAAMLNAHLRDNLLEMAVPTLTTPGAIAVASGSHALAELAPSPDSPRFLSVVTGAPAWVTGSELLGTTAYNPSAGNRYPDGFYFTTSTTFADVDATNLRVTFTAPASGDVVVVLSAYAKAGGTGTNYARWNLREASSDIAGTDMRLVGEISSRHVARAAVGGLTPGSTHTYKWGHAVSGGTGTAGLFVGTGPAGTYGPAIMSVWAA